jgi:hypothetical protein
MGKRDKVETIGQKETFGGHVLNAYRRASNPTLLTIINPKAKY